MKVKIDRSQIGTSDHLVAGSDGSLSWERDTEFDLSFSSGSEASLTDIIRITGSRRPTPELSTPAQVRAFQSLGVDTSSIPWLSALGRDQFSSRVQGIIDTVQDISEDKRLIEYITTYIKCHKFLSDLSRPKIDTEELRRHVAECELGLSVIKTLKSFTPDETGLAPRIVYDHAGTATGRLTVKEGPSILTLPKSCRSVIRSPRGGELWEVDFVSLEPRFVLHVMGRPAPRDIYEDIRQKVFNGELDRKAVKTATISALYGSSADLMSELTGASAPARSVIRRVKEYFGAEALGGRLTAEATASGSLHNYYGRPLPDMTPGTKESKLISYYVQSSCVDTSLLGFIDLCERIKSLGARPIYVIHDALLIDVPSESVEEFLHVCSAGVDLSVGHFELSSNRIS